MIVKAQYYDPSFLDRYKIAQKPKGNPHGRKRADYLDCVCAFDIETTTIGDYNFMYIWQWQFDEDLTVVGRTWDEFRRFISQILDHLGEKMMVAFVHNLSYEFQYLRGIYDFKPEDVFCTDSRKVAKCTIFDRIEFRCSQFLSNLSLKNFTKQMGVKHQKLSGEDFDYSKERFPWTELSDKEMDYATYDVIGLVEAVKARMAAEGDSLYTLPLTSTGFSRRDMKNAMRHYSKRKLLNMQPDLEVYDMIAEAFRGGDVHANRYYAGKIVEGVVSFDRSSSYPDVMCNCPMPMQDWRKDEGDPDILMQHIRDAHAVLFEIGLVNPRLRWKDWGCPYLSRDKSRAIKDGIFDNGRILSASYLETTITDIDFRIIVEEYDFDDMVIGRLFWTNYEPLPAAFRNVITTYYSTKTALKGDETQSVRYNLTKARINSLYGMCAQRMIQNDIKFIDGQFVSVETDREETLKKESRRTFRNFAWGCWVTAWARYRLHEGIRIAEGIGSDRREDFRGSFVYCDTDSVKYIDKGQDWSSYNFDRQTDSIQSGASAIDSKGKIHYMGVYEEDGKYSRFCTLGSKRYAYEDPELHITVSGVGKYAGAKELGCLENFKDGFTWHHSGKTESIYVDEPDRKYLHFEEGDVELVPYIIIRDTTYTLGLTDEYRDLLALLNL